MVRIFTLLFEVILGLSRVAYNLGTSMPSIFVWSKNMNMISTGAFQTEMDASNRQPTVAEKFAAVWEKKNAKAARAGGVSLMALSLAACGVRRFDHNHSDNYNYHNYDNHHSCCC